MVVIELILYTRGYCPDSWILRVGGRMIFIRFYCGAATVVVLVFLIEGRFALLI